MKIIPIVFCFFLIANVAQAQIDYSYFKQTWCKCLPDSGVAASDTLTFRIKSEACKVNTYSKERVSLEQQEYTFQNKNIVHIYEAFGTMPRKDYEEEATIEVEYKMNAEGDTIGKILTSSKIQFSPALSGCTLLDLSYKLNKSKNRLIIFKEKGRPFQYEILFLSSKMMLLRKIKE